MYYADFDDAQDEPPAIMWRDLFELNVALREAARIYTDDAIDSAITKIESVVREFVVIEHTVVEPLLVKIYNAVNEKQQIKIVYTAGYSDESVERTIEPRDVKELNGHSYVRAFCTTRGAWRTFRVDRINAIVAQAPATETRPVDDVPNWLTNIAESGEEVVCIVDAATRYLFEPLPGAQWVSLGEGKHAVKFRVATSEFLDHLMLLAGPGAVVVTPKYASAGRALAQSILDAL